MSSSTPTRRASTSPWALTMRPSRFEIRNDGVRPGARGAGMGLRLSAFEALQRGRVVEFGPCPGDCWRVRLVVARAYAEA